jgi:hypothetical protein
LNLLESSDLAGILGCFAREFACVFKLEREIDFGAGLAYLRDVAFERWSVFWFGFDTAVVTG